MSLIKLSLIANIVVLVPLVTLLILGDPLAIRWDLGDLWRQSIGVGFGAILLASVALFMLALSNAARIGRATRILLGLQVVFSIGFAASIGFATPMAIAGLLLSLLHIVTVLRR